MNQCLNEDCILNDYSTFVEMVSVYSTDNPLGYLIPALIGEVGELSSIYAKWQRKKLNPHSLISQRGIPMEQCIPPAQAALFEEELGDILWMLQAFCNELSIDLPSLMDQNKKKLRKRLEKNKLDSLQGERDGS